MLDTEYFDCHDNTSFSRGLLLEKVAGAIKRDDRFRVDDFAAVDHREGLLERHAADANHLVVIEHARSLRQLARQVQLDSFVAEAWHRDDRAEMVPSRGRDACLFAEFAPRAFERVLAGVAASRGNLAHPAADRVTILTQHRDRHVVIQRDDRARTGMTDDGEIDLHAAGQRRGLDAEINDTQFQNRTTI